MMVAHQFIEQNYPVNQVLDYVDLKPSSFITRRQKDQKGKVKAPLLLNRMEHLKKMKW